MKNYFLFFLEGFHWTCRVVFTLFIISFPAFSETFLCENRGSVSEYKALSKNESIGLVAGPVTLSFSRNKLDQVTILSTKYLFGEVFSQNKFSLSCDVDYVPYDDAFECWHDLRKELEQKSSTESSMHYYVFKILYVNSSATVDYLRDGETLVFTLSRLYLKHTNKGPQADFSETLYTNVVCK